MRWLLCKKIHCHSCSFICFCKPPSSSAHHLYNPNLGPFKLENTPHVPSTVVVEEENTTSDGEGNIQQIQNSAKSCMRKEYKEPCGAPKKKVQWRDRLGEELVHIKEFDSGDRGDSSNNLENRRCVCIIL